jgi:Tfp pilus assembly protein PilZ
MSLSSFGQVRQDFLDALTDKFQKYCNSVQREEIYVHTDRQEYVAGEDVWLSIYLIDRLTAKPSGSGKIVYLEILNPGNRPVVQKRVGLEQGFGTGQIVIPDTISSGIYTLRAYTNWMKNFLPENCFSKRLVIHNALSGKNFNINPELKAKNANFTGAKSSSLAGTGLSVEIDKQNQENIRIIINSTKDFRLAGGSTCYLFVQTHGIINFRQVVSLSDEGTVVNMPRDILIPGINHITLFSTAGKPVFERLIYTPYTKTGSLTIASPENLKSREKVRIGVEIKNGNAASENLSTFSISVASGSGNYFPGIDDYMIFGSEFGVLSDELLKSILNGQADSVDKFLLSMKSSWIDWNKILSGNLPVIRYKKEIENHFLYGRLINKSTQVPDPEQYLFLSMPGKNAMFQYAKTDKNGDFTFTLPLDGNIKDLIIQPENAERNNNIRIESSFSDKYPELAPAYGTSVTVPSQDNSKLAVNYQVMKIYRSDVLPDKSSPVTFTGGTRRFYGKPDIELVMDDYIKLPVMQEVFFELTPGIFLKKKKSEYEITISDPVENRIYDKAPLLFIDGVVVKDPGIIANLDPEIVEKIDAVKSRYFVGEYLMFGLVNVITRAGDFSNVTLPDYAVRLPYRITEPAVSFSYPDYTSPEKRQSHIPDFRNTLYWNPSFKTDKEGKAEVEFWSSDFRSDYEISIQGFNGNGEPVSIRKIIKVQ